LRRRTTPEWCWDSICRLSAEKMGVSPREARSILEDHGYHAYGHTGINDALEVLEWALRQRGSGRRFLPGRRSIRHSEGWPKPTSYGGIVDEQKQKFKLELAKEWLMLQTHKWRRPKWVKFPRSMLDDARWIRLSDEARSAWMSILLIASENPNSELPAPDILFRRLRALGNCFQGAKFDRIILELNQCGFLLKTSPELQSYRVSEISTPYCRPNGRR
jgi:hypothetical protein